MTSDAPGYPIAIPRGVLMIASDWRSCWL